MRPLSHLLGCCIFLLVNFSTASAQSIDTRKLDSLFNSLDRNKKAMGSIAIFKNSNPVYTKAIGISHENDSARFKATEKNRYRIGTVTQIMTATMAAMLVEQKKLEWDDLLVDFFPDIPNSNYITVLQLVQHRSGLYDYLNDTSITNNLEKPLSKEKFLATVARRLPEFDPNRKQSFNNVNYILVGMIIEQITGKTLAEALKEMITDPAGLKNTYYGGKISSTRNEAQSFLYENDWIRAAESHPSIVAGSGAVISTASDMAEFMSELYNEKFISLRTVEFMIGAINDYSAGIMLYEMGGQEVYGIMGNVDGYMSAAFYHPDSALSIAYLSNGQYYHFEEIMDGVIRICFDKPYVIPTFVSIPLTQEELNIYTGVYSIQGSPLKMEVYIKGKTLFVKATGQSEEKLIATSKDKFIFDRGGIILEFHPDKRQLTLVQGEALFLFDKD